MKIKCRYLYTTFGNMSVPDDFEQIWIQLDKHFGTNHAQKSFGTGTISNAENEIHTFEQIWIQLDRHFGTNHAQKLFGTGTISNAENEIHIWLLQ